MTAQKGKENAGSLTGHAAGDDGLAKLVRWYEANRRTLIAASTALVVIAGGVWFVTTARARKEAFGQRALQSARASVQAGNLPLAESDLSRVVSDYDGTAAGGEAAILLGHVRLLQDEDAAAVAGLRDFINSNPPDYLMEPAYSLLGAALEEVGDMAAASQAYEDGAESARFEFRRAELLNSAARTRGLAGDWEAARDLYQRVIDDFADAPAATEARVRLGEIEFAGREPA